MPDNSFNASNLESVDSAIPMPKPSVTFEGNNYDLMVVVGVTIGAAVLLSCFTLNLGWYCLPIVPVILGGIGLATAKDSVNPERTRLLAWLSLASGGAILILIILGILAYILIIVFAIAADSSGF
jgi:hypothetical protein